jgi:GH24 family phage-related lysozyme (muramidase)
MNKEAAISIAADFIKKWEKLGSKSHSGGSYSPAQAEKLPLDTPLYSFPDGKSYSIGWGTYNELPSDNTPVTSDLSITKQRADDEFRIEVYNRVVPVLDKLVTTDLNEYQYAALISFGYNAGPYALKLNHDRLLDAVNNGGDVETVLKSTALTDSRTGKVSAGLINRRKDEANLYSGNYSEIYSYYLRNATTINYATIGIIVIALTGYVFYLKKIRKV